jgi:hypothetical protein
MATATAVVLVYYTVPFDGRFSGLDAILLPVGLLGLGLVGWYGVRDIVRSPTPRAKAIEVLATVVPFFLVLFASMYFVTVTEDPDAFSSGLSRTDSLYFTVTVFSTVGFGDIVPVSQYARIVVMVQMLGDLFLIGAGVRLLTGAVREGFERRARGTVDGPMSPLPPMLPDSIPVERHAEPLP